MQLKLIQDKLTKVVNIMEEMIFVAITDRILFSDKFEYKSNDTIRDEDTNQYDLRRFLLYID